jgi:ectoine hydroxylase-related dioxygenase (phytanoyl-CoA dioxygenase family)
MDMNTTLRATGHGGSLSAEQVAFYDREGYLVLEGLLNADDMAPCREALAERVDEIAQELARDGLITDLLENEPFEYRLARLFQGLDVSHFLRYGRSWRDRKNGYFTFMSNPKILDVVESLIGGEIFANPVFNARPKVPRVAAGAVPWHQDRSYWPDANCNPVITVWVPLVDANEENGCLAIWPRTHKKKLLSYHAEKITGTGYWEVDPEHINKLKREAVTLPVAAGDAIIFNDRCIHMSTVNHSDHIRWSVDLRYQPTDQDPLLQHGTGFLARSHKNPHLVAKLEDWEANRMQRPLEPSESLSAT